MSAPRSILALLSALALCLASTPAAAQDGDPVKDGVFGLTAGLCTLVYTPIKIAYAAVGLPISGIVLLLSFNTDAASRIGTAAVGGDYVITPEHIRRQRTLRVTGGP